VPIIGPQNSKPFLRALELSAAVRTDKYSDFGSTTNPRFGLRWSPASGLSLRGSYGRSFRAPTEAELLSGILPTVYIASFASPNGNGTVPAIVYDGRGALTAERSRSVDFGVEYKPVSIEGLDVSLNYYDIRFDNRIVQVFAPYNALQSPNIYGQLITHFPNDAAAQTYLNDAIASGANYEGNFSGGTGTTGVQYAFNDSLQNASLVRQSGIDFLVRMISNFSSGNLTAQLNATFVDRIDTAYTAGASFVNLVSTYDNPPKWRFRTVAAWTNKCWEVNGAVSTVGSYVNTAGAGNPAVSSWTTLDLGARLFVGDYLTGSGWKGVTLGLSVLNALDRDPPHISTPSETQPITYDPNNASPLGRFVALELRKRW
jgi:iron complex outermembrane recepter protein